jgi:hypothetical protein
MNPNPTKEVASEMNCEEDSSILDSHVLDPEIGPEELATTGQNSSRLTLPSTIDGHQSAIVPTTPNRQRTGADQVASRRAHSQPKSPRRPPAPAEKSSGLMKQVAQFFAPSPRSEPVDSDVDQLLCVKEQEIGDLEEASLERENIIRTISETRKQDAKPRERFIQDGLEDSTRKWKAREKDLLRQIEQIDTEYREAMGKLQDDVR